MNRDAGAHSANADQIDYWNSENGRKWVRHQEALDCICSKVRDRLLERAAPQVSERVVDIGCGAGETSLAVARLAGPEGRVLGVDVSEPLLALAERRAQEAGLRNLRFRLADAQSHDLSAEAAELAISRFGVMFFSDPAAAFANIRRGLKPGGRIVFACWASLEGNPWFSIPRQAAIERLGQPAPSDPDAPGPMAFRDKDRVVEILSRAGYGKIEAETESLPLPFFRSLEETAALVSSLGPAARIMRELGGGDEDAAAIAETVKTAFRPFAEANGGAVPSTINFFSAQTS
jgi:SAM-dependent methyltransferase